MKILMVARRHGSDESTLTSLPLAVGKSARKQDNGVYLRRWKGALTLRHKVLGGTLLLTACLGGPWTDFTSADSKDGIFPSADQVGKLTVFNIGGNKVRLIAAIHYNRGKIYIRAVLTHAEYDEQRWRK